jgi:hypothetical protein
MVSSKSVFGKGHHPKQKDDGLLSFKEKFEDHGATRWMKILSGV